MASRANSTTFSRNQQAGTALNAEKGEMRMRVTTVKFKSQRTAMASGKIPSQQTSKHNGNSEFGRPAVEKDKHRERRG
jgi:hypothetical protein